MAKKIALRAKRNIWGNIVVFKGAERFLDFGNQFDAINALSDLLKSGEYQISEKSDISVNEIYEHRRSIGDE